MSIWKDTISVYDAIDCNHTHLTNDFAKDISNTKSQSDGDRYRSRRLPSPNPFDTRLLHDKFPMKTTILHI